MGLLTSIIEHRSSDVQRQRLWGPRVLLASRRCIDWNASMLEYPSAETIRSSDSPSANLAFPFWPAAELSIAAVLRRRKRWEPLASGSARASLLRLKPTFKSNIDSYCLDRTATTRCTRNSSTWGGPTLPFGL